MMMRRVGQEFSGSPCYLTHLTAWWPFGWLCIHHPAWFLLGTGDDFLLPGLGILICSVSTVGNFRGDSSNHSGFIYNYITLMMTFLLSPSLTASSFHAKWWNMYCCQWFCPVGHGTESDSAPNSAQLVVVHSRESNSNFWANTKTIRNSFRSLISRTGCSVKKQRFIFHATFPLKGRSSCKLTFSAVDHSANIDCLLWAKAGNPLESRKC
jgi:hypothetical protein